MQSSPTDEEKKRAFELKAELKVYQLFQIAEVINLASTRGAFKGSEMSHVGALFDNLNAGIEKAFKIAKELIEKEAATQQAATEEIKVSDPISASASAV